MVELVAVGDTFLKLEPVQAKLLSDKTRIRVPKGGKIRGKLVGKTSAGHRLIELDAARLGYFNWWIFPEHWQGLDKDFSADGVNWNDFSSRVSRYFTVLDVTQGDDRRIPRERNIQQNILALANELDKVRDAWGAPIGVTSWFRPEPINAQVGGVPGSSHVIGIAADIFPYTGDEWAFEEWLDGFWGDKALGYGQYAGRGFTHVDLRTGGIRWNY
jgi:putative chitinase